MEVLVLQVAPLPKTFRLALLLFLSRRGRGRTGWLGSFTYVIVVVVVVTWC